MGILGFIYFPTGTNVTIFFDIILTPYPNRVEIGSQRVFLLFIPQNIVIFNRINPNLSH